MINERFSLLRVSDTMIEILDARHGGLVSARVFFKTEAGGSGWKVGPLNQRKFSRKLHATPEDAIASMKYLTKAAARAALVAQSVGAVAYLPTTAVPRVGMERRWADLANELALVPDQKRRLEDFMSDLQDEAFDSGAEAILLEARA